MRTQAFQKLLHHYCLPGIGNDDVLPTIVPDENIALERDVYIRVGICGLDCEMLHLDK